MELAELATDDFQKRDGRYPASGKPDRIAVNRKVVSMDFKNTSEAEAKKWARNYLTAKGFDIESIQASQDGDYQDDWVTVGISVK
jgi:hypothetical protein